MRREKRVAFESQNQVLTINREKRCIELLAQHGDTGESDHPSSVTNAHLPWS